tara:strand:- start:2370 stop:3155 length:786 start_codon:yes stop_codon:yes gene_type:complete
MVLSSNKALHSDNFTLRLKIAGERGVMSFRIYGVSLDFRDKALEAAEYKCYKCGSAVNDRTAMYSYATGKPESLENMQVSCPKCELLKVENLFSSFTSPAVESAAKLWLHSYIKSPLFTVLISLVIGLASAFAVNQLSTYIDSSYKVQPVSSDFKEQLEQLDVTEDSLKTLLTFVQSQKETTALNEQRIQQLEHEKARLEPLVKADKATVVALFSEQESRASENTSKERWFGFGLGIVASIVASFLIAIGKNILISRRRKS